MYSYINQSIGLVVSVHQWTGRLGFNPRSSHTRLKKKWYLMAPCLTLSIIRCRSRVKWRNPGKGVIPFPTPQCSSYCKGSFQVTLNYGHQLYFLSIYIKYLIWIIFQVIIILSEQLLLQVSILNEKKNLFDIKYNCQIWIIF